MECFSEAKHLIWLYLKTVFERLKYSNVNVHTCVSFCWNDEAAAVLWFLYAFQSTWWSLFIHRAEKYFIMLMIVMF